MNDVVLAEDAETARQLLLQKLVDDGKTIFADGEHKPQICFSVSHPKDENGVERDQTPDMARNMRYAATLGLQQIPFTPEHAGTAIICGGGPSIKGQLDKIKELATNPDSSIFALNWTHNWLIQNGVKPTAMVFFEIDAEPDDILGSANPETIYFVCSHCHPKTFDQLLARVPKKNIFLWHMIPDNELGFEAYKELYANQPMIGGGIATFLRSISLATCLGYRNFELFGVDSSYPDDNASTHVEGYPTICKPEEDGFDVWAKDAETGDVRRFRTVSYLAFQAEEFKQFCNRNHHLFRMRVHGDGLLPFIHKHMWPTQYD